MIKQLKELKLLNLLVLAVLIRLLIMPFYFHPDIKTYHFQSSFLKQGVWDIYSYLGNNKENLPNKEEFVYFPLTYFFLGGYQTAVSPLLGNDFTVWLNDASQANIGAIGVYRYLFLLKLPYLFLDIFIGFLLLFFFREASDKKRAFTFWLFNPFSIILIYIFSNVDIITVFLSTLSLLFALKKRLALSALIIGMAAAFKVYPLLFLPFLLLSGKDLKQKGLILLACIGPFLMVILPFLRSTEFREATLVSGLTTRALLSSVNIGFGEAIIIPVVLISLLFFGVMNKTDSEEKLPLYYVALLLLLFSFIHFHIQWLLWVMPFIVIILVRRVKFAWLVITLAIFAFLIPILYDDKSMSVSLLSAISGLYVWVPIPFSAAQKIYDAYSIQSVLHSLLAGGSLVFIWQLFKRGETS